MSLDIARYLGFEPNAVVRLHRAGTFGVVTRIDDNDDTLSTMRKRIWCHFRRDNGEWSPDQTWMTAAQGRVIDSTEGANEIFASYAAWRLTQ